MIKAKTSIKVVLLNAKKTFFNSHKCMANLVTRLPESNLVIAQNDDVHAPTQRLIIYDPFSHMSVLSVKGPSSPIATAKPVNVLVLTRDHNGRLFK